MKLFFWKKKVKENGDEVLIRTITYDSIENLPIWNWNKIIETNDFTYLKINRINNQLTKSEYSTLSKAWDKIFSEYIDRFGFSDNFLTIHQKKKEIAILQCQMIEFSDRSICTFVDIAKKELAELEVENGKSDFYTIKTIVEKFLKFQIDAKKTTVAEFHCYIEMLKQEIKSA